MSTHADLLRKYADIVSEGVLPTSDKFYAMDFDETIRKLAHMTSINDHIGALVAGTKLLGLTGLLDKAEMLLRIRNKLGYLPPEFSVDTIKIYKK